MVNKSIIFLSGVVFGLSLSSDVFAGKKKLELDYDFKGPMDRHLKKVGKPKAKPVETKPIQKVYKDRKEYVPGSFNDVNPQHQSHFIRGYLSKHQPSA